MQYPHAALLEAGQSSDKIAHNAVRGIGHALVAYLGGRATHNAGVHGSYPAVCPDAAPHPAWVLQGLEFILCSLETGNSKVQWNCCYALGSLFGLEQAWSGCVRAKLEDARDALVTLVQACNTPAKVAGHAADALRRIPEAHWYEEVVVGALPRLLVAQEQCATYKHRGAGGRSAVGQHREI